MRYRVIVALALAFGAVGCAPRGSTCLWPDEPSIALNLERFSQRRHLIADVRAAEEIAIHYADVTRGHRSGRYAGGDEYTKAREQCLTTLAARVANRHSIDPAG